VEGGKEIVRDKKKTQGVMESHPAATPPSSSLNVRKRKEETKEAKKERNCVVVRMFPVSRHYSSGRKRNERATFN